MTDAAAPSALARLKIDRSAQATTRRSPALLPWAMAAGLGLAVAGDAGDADVAAVQAAMFDPFEYLMARHKDGLLKLDFKAALGKVSYHIPCHGRVQNIGKKTEEMLKLIGEKVTLQLNTVERCSGHAGTYGVKKPYHETAMKIGKPVFKLMAKDEPDWIGSDCPMAGHHIAQGMANNALPAAKIAHPLSLLRIAYGI